MNYRKVIGKVYGNPLLSGSGATGLSGDNSTIPRTERAFMSMFVSNISVSFMSDATLRIVQRVGYPSSLVCRVVIWNLMYAIVVIVSHPIKVPLKQSPKRLFQILAHLLHARIQVRRTCWMKRLCC